MLLAVLLQLLLRYYVFYVLVGALNRRVEVIAGLILLQVHLDLVELVEAGHVVLVALELVRRLGDNLLLLGGVAPASQS